jgi:hypothetical protein
MRLGCAFKEKKQRAEKNKKCKVLKEVFIIVSRGVHHRPVSIALVLKKYQRCAVRNETMIYCWTDSHT